MVALGSFQAPNEFTSQKLNIPVNTSYRNNNREV